MLIVGILIALVVGAALGAGIGRRGAAKAIDSLAGRVDRYALDSAGHRETIDSLEAERSRSDSLATLLRLRAGVARVAASHRDTAATHEAVLAESSLSASDSALHWRAAYLTRTEERDSLLRALATLDSAISADSVARAALSEAFHKEEARRRTADSLVIDLRVALESVRPKWTDHVVAAVGFDPGGRVRGVVGLRVASLRDAARLVPKWLR